MAWLGHIYLTIHSLEQIHNYNTRNKDLIRLPLGKTTKFQTIFKYKIILPNPGTLFLVHVTYAMISLSIVLS